MPITHRIKERKPGRHSESGLSLYRGLPRRRIAGQSIIMAVMVMFLLMFLGGIFVALLRRNLTFTERHGDMLNAQKLSEAGVEFVNSQLTNSVEGADWRPKPETPGRIAAGPAGCREAITSVTPDPHDPDFQWIRQWASSEGGKPFTIQDTRAAPTLVNGARVYPTINMNEEGPSGGFTRIDYGGGRFLIRVTYNPNNDPTVGPVAPDARTDAKGSIIKEPSALSRFLMIESIGREGIVDPNDPTTYVPESLRRQIIAFKPISLVDYVRFITDHQHSGSAFTLGAPKFPLLPGTDKVSSDTQAVNFGVPSQFFTSNPTSVGSQPGHVHNLDSFYGPIRSNGGLRIKGEPMFVLNEDPKNGGRDAGIDPQPTRGDRIEVVGDIQRASDDADLYLLAPDLSPAAKLWNSTNPDALPAISQAKGYIAQGVNRIEAPDLGSVDTNTNVPRYRLLTRFSTPVLPNLSPAQSEVAAKNGLGAGIYLDNTNQHQVDSGRFTMIDDWMQPANNVTSNWTGHIYNPPGVRIQLIPHPLELPKETLLDGQVVTEANGVEIKQGLIRISRSDRTWRIPDKNNAGDKDGIDTGLYTEYFQYPLAPGETAENAKYPPAFGNGVIYAEGNVRVWGKLPPDRSNPCARGANDQILGEHLTIVSNGTIYVEGSVLKGEHNGADQPQRSGIALLAEDYVTVNPTAYFAVPPETNSGDWSNWAGEWYNALYLPPQDRYSFSILNGVRADTYLSDNQSQFSVPQGGPPITTTKQVLYTQATGESSPGAGALLQINGQPDGNPYYHPWWATIPNRQYGHLLPGRQWAYETTPLMGGDIPWNTGTSVPNFLQFSWKQFSPAWISKVAVAPLDVRIEAAMYAENGSFFIIPGVPFNNDPADSRAAFIESGGLGAGGNGIRHGGLRTVSNRSPYPFAQEPMDIKITVYGSVAENKPAPEEAQEAAARQWGWTPLKKGSTAQLAHGGDGLSFQFDPSFRLALRFDAYGRPLPLMPRLPVSPDLVYSGEAH